MSFLEPLYWYWTNQLDNKTIISINDFIEKNYDEVEPNSIPGKGKNTNSKNIIVGKLCNNFPKLNDMLGDCFKASRRNFGFNLYENIGNEYALFNEYDHKIQGKYDWHIDDSGSLNYDLKLTGLINLSDKKFTGGEFELNTGDIKRIDEFSKPGSMILFRSNTLHRVLPLKSGNRKTLAFFLSGPRLQ